MDVTFGSSDLDRLETDPKFEAGYSPAIVKSFRKRMQQIRAAEDERALYALRSLNFEKLKGDRSHQYSIRLNDQWRLILEFSGSNKEKAVQVVEIVDYH